MYYNKKYQDFIDDNFFVIDSDNCKDTKSKLYGFVIQENKISAFKKNYNQHIEKKDNGTYINIIREKKKIIIEQDAVGSYGLFLYKTENYFALSNSFFYLVLYLKENNILTLSLDTAYLKYFITQPLSSLSIERTLIKEIQQIDKDMKIVIDTSSNTIDYIRDKLPTKIYDIDSPECFEILDKWFSKYCSLIQSLYNNGNDISTDLSGGKDSRLTLTLFYHLNLLQKIKINSSTAATTRAQEDYKIASKIAKQYNFPLNNNQHSVPVSKVNPRMSPELSLLLGFFIKLGIHKEFKMPSNYSLKPVFRVGGSAGENIRNTFKSSQEEFLKKIHINNSERYTGISNQYQIEILKESFNYLQQIPHKDMGIELYNYTRNKTHFGKGAVVGLIRNGYEISPLQDPMLQLININDDKYDDLLLISIIYQRYMPHIIDIELTGEQIKQSVKEQADAIQKKYPKHIEIKENFTLDIDERIIPENENSFINPLELLAAFFRTKEVKNFSSFFFNDKIYDYYDKLTKDKTMHQNDANAKTLTSLCIFTKIILTNNFNIYSYLTNTLSLWDAVKRKLKLQKNMLDISKLFFYTAMVFLTNNFLPKPIISSSFLEKLKNKQKKYYEKVLFNLK